MLKYLGSAWARLEEWLNASAYRRVRYIDLLLAVGFIICVSYYWWAAGWQWAILGGLMYTMMTMIALWLL